MNPSLKTKILSLLLKLTVIAGAAAGTLLSAGAGRNTFMGGSRVFMFFTIQSNLLIALLCLIGIFLLFGKRPVPDVWFTVKFVGTVAITLTGLVFCFVLAPTLKGRAWNVQNILTHVVVPIAAVLDFFVTGVYGSIPKKNVLYVVLPPLAYVIYAAVGYVRGWEFLPGVNYPYFFLNWGSPAGAFGFSPKLPFMGCGWWILALLGLLLAVGFGYLKLLDLLKAKRKG